MVAANNGPGMKAPETVMTATDAKNSKAESIIGMLKNITLLFQG
jgi:hypothetical protein